MIISTGYYGGMRSKTYVNPVSVSISTPPGIKLPTLSVLTPSRSLLTDYKKGLVDEKGYVIRYAYEHQDLMRDETEARKTLLQKLAFIADGKNEVTLMCWEKDGDFCHRYIAKDWLEGKSWSDIINETVLDSILQRKELIIAGIGSRSMKDNAEAHSLFRKTFNAFDSLNSDDFHVILRSGGAEGADSIAEHSFSGEKQIILPWKGFNGNHAGEIIYTDDKDASAMIGWYHPAADKLSQGARKCLERDIWQLLGCPQDNPRKKTDIVICWIEPGKTGGTAFTAGIAKKLGIPVFNIADNEELEKLRKLFGLLRDFCSGNS